MRARFIGLNWVDPRWDPLREHPRDSAQPAADIQDLRSGARHELYDAVGKRLLRFGEPIGAMLYRLPIAPMQVLERPARNDVEHAADVQLREMIVPHVPFSASALSSLCSNHG